MSTTLLDEVRSGTAPPLVPITVEQYHLMIRDGILQDGDPIELIDGLLVRKDRSARGENLMTHNPRHAFLISRLMRLLTGPCEAARAFLRIQLPVTLNSTNCPEPDIAVVRGSEEDYADRHPGPADLPLVIEIADSSVGTDRSTKQRLYATVGIPPVLARQPARIAGRSLRATRPGVRQVCTPDNPQAGTNPHVEFVTDGQLGNQHRRSVPMIRVEAGAEAAIGVGSRVNEVECERSG